MLWNADSGLWIRHFAKSKGQLTISQSKLVNLMLCFKFFFPSPFPWLPNFTYNLHSKSKWQSKWFVPEAHPLY